MTIAVDQLAWLRLLDPPPLARCEPAPLRYRLLHVPARLTRGQRRRWLRLPAGWPWAQALVEILASDPDRAREESRFLGMQRK